MHKMRESNMEFSDNIESLSFEKALRTLEDIVARISSGDCELDEMIKIYEIGIKYLDQCKKKLAEAETKVQIIGKDLPQSLQTEDTDGL